MINLVYAALLALAGNSVIYSGLAFINGDFFSKALDNFYNSSSVFMRLVIMSLLFAPLANFIFSRVYKMTDPAYAGMIMLAALVVILVAKAMLLGMGSLTPRLIMSVALLTVCSAWVAYELHR